MAEGAAGTIDPLDLSTYKRIAEPSYVEGLTARSLADIRAMRGECQHVEEALSYLRRLVQGHVEIVRCEQQRRAAGQPADLAALVAALPRALSENLRTDGGGRLPSGLATPDDVSLTDELDAVCDAVRLSHVPDLDDDELDDLAAELAALEQTVSSRRRVLFARLDVLSAELAERYRSGAASVDALLVDEVRSPVESRPPPER